MHLHAPASLQALVKDSRATIGLRTGKLIINFVLFPNADQIPKIIY